MSTRTVDMSTKKTRVTTYEEPVDDRDTPMYRARGVFRNPLFWILVILAPLFIYGILWALKPSFVITIDSNNVQVISQQNLFLWTAIFTVIAWIILYFLFYAFMPSGFTWKWGASSCPDVVEGNHDDE